ncbi:MAG: hypothetical protein NUK65_11285, partial [Firmicutes bacterium]|nr:hypothetical protein [Bacillota bacterium]
GNVFERSELFLNTFAGFKRPSRAEWKQIQSIYDVRNVLVHHDGFIDNYNRLNKLLVFIEEQSGLSESNGTIRLEKGFCVYCIDVIDNLMKTICEEVQNLCNNVKRFENPD